VGRLAALLILIAAIVAWYEVVPHLGRLSQWPNVLLIGFVVMPAFFALDLIAVPAWRDRRLIVAIVVFAAAAVALSELDAPVFANLAKFAAVTTGGWVFLTLFEQLSWAVLVAVIIPWVDAYSVWRGPTKAITEHHAAVFTSLSVAFVVPGGDAARLGLPDVFFFAVFLGASVRWGLRPLATWLAMSAALGLTIVATTFWSNGGLPALPAIAIGFLLPNADLIWRRLRGEPRVGNRAEVPLDRPADG
jgi:hypothetical protein